MNLLRQGATRNLCILNLGALDPYQLSFASTTGTHPAHKHASVDTYHEALERYFSDFGTIECINIAHLHKDGQKAAFINFSSISEAGKALEGARKDRRFDGCKLVYGKDRCAQPLVLIPTKEAANQQQTPMVGPFYYEDPTVFNPMISPYLYPPDNSAHVMMEPMRYHPVMLSPPLPTTPIRPHLPSTNNGVEITFGDSPRHPFTGIPAPTTYTPGRNLSTGTAKKNEGMKSPFHE